MCLCLVSLEEEILSIEDERNLITLIHVCSFLRRGHTVLKAALPPKEEYVFMVGMSDIQKQLYKKFMDSVQDAAQNGWVNNNPLKAFAVCCKVRFS